METAAQLEQAAGGSGARLELGWAPRTENEEADALSNEDFSKFAAQHRVPVDLTTMKWLYLDRLMKAGVEFDQARQEQRLKHKGLRGRWLAATRRKGVEERLRFRDPW
jgi:hypothetical protein